MSRQPLFWRTVSLYSLMASGSQTSMCPEPWGSMKNPLLLLYKTTPSGSCTPDHCVSQPSSKKLPPTVDGDEHTDPQLVSVQKLRDCGVPSLNGRLYHALFSPDLAENTSAWFHAGILSAKQNSTGAHWALPAREASCQQGGMFSLLLGAHDTRSGHC